MFMKRLPSPPLDAASSKDLARRGSFDKSENRASAQAAFASHAVPYSTECRLACNIVRGACPAKQLLF
jgi:hypothetical protein